MRIVEKRGETRPWLTKLPLSRGNKRFWKEVYPHPVMYAPDMSIAMTIFSGR